MTQKVLELYWKKKGRPCKVWNLSTSDGCGIEYYSTQCKMLQVFQFTLSFYFFSTNNQVCNRMEGPLISVELLEKKALKVLANLAGLLVQEQ